MPKPLPEDDPNLQLALGRLRRTLWVWAALLGGMGVLASSLVGRDYPFLAVPWLAGAALLALSLQPAMLAVAALLWGLTLVHMLPGFAEAFGPDPLIQALGSGPFETIGLAVVRLVLMVTAWNQFMFYRLLYGTAGMAGLDPDHRPIPPMVPNRSDLLAGASLALGALSVTTTFAALGFLEESLLPIGIQAALPLAMLGIALGLAAAFSPVRRRWVALVGVLVSVAGFLLTFWPGRPG